MKKEMPPAVIAVVVAVVVLLLGFIAYKKFAIDPNATNLTPQEVKQQAQIRKNVMGAHRDSNGHYVDNQGRPIDPNATSSTGGQ